MGQVISFQNESFAYEFSTNFLPFPSTLGNLYKHVSKEQFLQLRSQSFQSASGIREYEQKMLEWT